MLKRWREVALENIIAEIETTKRSPRSAPAPGVRRRFGRRECGARLATADAQARKAVEAVDAERIRYLQNLLVDAGIAPDVVAMRARVMNWTYLGFAISSSKLEGELLAVWSIKELSNLFRG